MHYMVLQDFVTTSHRLRAGMIITEEDIDGPLPPEQWLEDGYLSEAPEGFSVAEFENRYGEETPT